MDFIVPFMVFILLSESRDLLNGLPMIQWGL